MQPLRTRIQTRIVSGPDQFFRSRLLTLSSEEISTWVDKMDEEANSIRQQSLKMSWYMRGGASYEDVMQMSYQERRLISDLIKDNLETTKNSKLPFF
jgi:hypothetical protein